MGAIIFTIKSIVITVLLIAFLQIEWSGRSLERRLSDFSRQTGILTMADTLAKGAIRVVRNNFDFDFENSSVNQKTDEVVNAAKMGFNQSEIYMSKKSETARRAIEKFREELKGESTDSTETQEDFSEDTY